MPVTTMRRVVDRPSTQLAITLTVAATIMVAAGDGFVLGAFLVLAGLLAGLALSGSV